MLRQLWPSSSERDAGSFASAGSVLAAGLVTSRGVEARRDDDKRESMLRVVEGGQGGKE